MADTVSLVKLKDVVDRYVYKYKVPYDDWDLYLEHAMDCFRELSIHHLRSFKTVTETTGIDGSITIPSDLVDLISLNISVDNQLWSLTENRKIDITAQAAGDTSQVKDAITTGFGAVGGVNDYYYYCDWVNSKFYINFAASTDILIQYISDGISLTADTYVPTYTMQVIDAYLRLKQAEIDGLGMAERNNRERILRDATAMMRRINLPSLDELKDVFRSVRTQVPIR